jgi:hypothetical protein
MTIVLFIFTYMRVSDNNKLLQYLFLSDDKPSTQASPKPVPLTKEVSPKKP